MKFLITGGAGFIGSHLAGELVKEGDVVLVDNLSQGSVDNFSHIKDKVTFIEADIADSEKMKSALEGVDIVFHHAAMRAVAPSVKDPDAYFKNNVEGTRKMLEVIKNSGVKKIIFASSSSVYGDNVSFPTKEDQFLDPLSPYAETKLQTEKDLVEFQKETGISYIIFRYFTVFGPKQSPKSKYAMAIPLFIHQLLNNQQVTIHGNGKQSRDFTYVKNIVLANILAIKREAAENQIFNIGNGESTTVNDLVKKLATIIGVDITPNHDDALPGESKHTLADTRKARQLLGYDPEFTLDEGLGKTVDYFKEHPFKD
tara:strand:- start:3703 stop:4641 length:939 start_codon:yes stop_codon:yes gene_type:complete